MYAATRAAEDRLWWYGAMQRISERLLEEHVEGVDLEVLDAGCGTGGSMANWLGRWGVVTGIDLSETALSYARQRGLTRLARASIAELPFPDERFDLVTSFDVLYHAWVNELAALREARRVLRMGGHLLIRVPANDWLRSAHDRAVLTRKRYGKQELVQRLQDAGFQVLAASYANTLLFPVAAGKRLAEPLLAALGDGSHTRPGGSDFRMPPSAINSALEWVLSLEAPLVARSLLPQGLSLFALVRKSV